MTQHTLLAHDGLLYLGDDLLVCLHEGGDCDTVSWPLQPGDSILLTSALYDEVNAGSLLQDGDYVFLPDGSLFGSVSEVHFIPAPAPGPTDEDKLLGLLEGIADAARAKLADWNLTPEQAVVVASWCSEITSRGDDWWATMWDNQKGGHISSKGATALEAVIAVAKHACHLPPPRG